MPIVLVDGPVSDISRGSETVGAGSSYQGTGHMQVSTNQMMTMRIGNQPAEIKTKSMFIVKDGERVIAAGKTSQGVLKIDAARNVSAGSFYYPPVILGWVLAACLLLLGIPFSIIIIGLPFVAAGVWMIFIVLRWRKSIAMVEGAAAGNTSPHTGCPACASSISVEDIFCGNCGRRIKAAQ